MRIRIKTRWSKENREISVEDSVSVLAFNSWKIGMQALLEIENQHFDIDHQMQRIRVLEEISAFMIQAVDRMVHGTIDDEDRATMITYYAKKMADHVHENAREYGDLDDYRSPFIHKLNERFPAYAETTWNEDTDEPGFSMSREFATNIAEVLGDRDRKWALDYIQQVLTPDFFPVFKRTIKSIGLIEDKIIPEQVGH
jgi:hypothetical protein